MAKKIGRYYYCSYCNTEYSDPVRADSCREKHDLIYVALSRDDLNRLINFIHLGHDELLTESMVNSLRKYLRGSR